MIESLLSALSGGQRALAGGEVIMLQSNGSFFAYQPILRALQRADMPLSHVLAYPADLSGAHFGETSF